MIHTKVYCIESLNRSSCLFFKNRTYNVTINNNFHTNVPEEYRHINRINICDDKGYTLEFDDTSPFGVNTYPKHFIDVSELRKQKLLKINGKI